jgi:SAM-dependent methyltransferase
MKQKLRMLFHRVALIKGEYTFQNRGFCYSCNRSTQFTAMNSWWRDNYLCDQCGSIPRERALMFCIEKFFPNWKELVIHESSPSPRGTSIRLANEAKWYTASQFYPGIQPGVMHNGFRNENLENLSFDDRSIDLHISQDVFEHIFDPGLAFKEIARTLKPGGAHIFTTPLVNKTAATEWCAKRGNGGKIEYILQPPEYHGNPVSDKGALVTVRWGYDIAEYIFKTSGLITEIIHIDNLGLGIRAELIEVLITRKTK